MAKNVFVRATVLHDVRGRIEYASSPDKQEHLMAYVSNMPKGGWAELSQLSRQRVAAYHPGKKVCEARELIIEFPNKLSEEDSMRLAINLRNDFSNNYLVPCTVAMHWNKSKNNYHAHLIFSERKIRREAYGESVATRNTYFNAQGKRSTKKDCLDENGELLPGCRLVKKGALLSEGSRFGAKNNRFAQEEWLHEEKERIAAWFNKRLGEEEWKVYDWKTDPHFPLVRIKKGEPAALTAWKERENEWRKEYNKVVDEMIENKEITFEEALRAKFKHQEQKARLRRERAANKQKWIKEWEAKKDRMAVEREYFAALRKKSLLGLAFELSLMIAGVDAVKRCTGVETVLIRNKPIKAYHDEKIQKMIDDMYVAAGKESPSVTMAKNRIERLKERLEKTDDIDEKIDINQKIKELKAKIDKNVPSQTIGR